MLFGQRRPSFHGRNVLSNADYWYRSSGIIHCFVICEDVDKCKKLGLYSLNGKTFYRQISCQIVYNDNRIALKFDRPLGSAAAEVPVKFKSRWNKS